MWCKTAHSVFVRMENSPQRQNLEQSVLVVYRQLSIESNQVGNSVGLFSPLILIQTKKITMPCGERTFIECLYCTKWERKDGSHTTATPSGAQYASENVLLWIFRKNKSTFKWGVLSRRIMNHASSWDCSERRCLQALYKYI